jgi:hypothetical protein
MQHEKGGKPMNSESASALRYKYRDLSEREHAVLNSLKQLGGDFYDYVNGLGNSRELSIAKTKIEEAVMWATKHVTK